MKTYQSLLLIFLIVLTSCNKNKETKQTNEPPKKEWKLNIEDEKLVGFSEDAFTKVKWFYWVKDQDTTSYKFRIAELKNDSLVSVAIEVEKQIDFKTCLDSLNALFPIIEKEFDLKNLYSLDIGQTIYYPDFAKEISSQFDKNFGKKITSHKKFNEMMMQTPITKNINSIIGKYNKKINSYSVEKFGLLEKSSFGYLIKDADFSDYPDFIIEGHVSVLFEDIKP